MLGKWLEIKKKRIVKRLNQKVFNNANMQGSEKAVLHAYHCICNIFIHPRQTASQ